MCSKDKFVKNGFHHTGNQRYLCKTCGYQSTREKPKVSQPKVRMLLALRNLGLSQLAIEQLLNINRTTSYRWKNEYKDELQSAPLFAVREFLRAKRNQFEFSERDQRIIDKQCVVIDVSVQKRALEFFKEEFKKARKELYIHDYVPKLDDDWDDAEFRKLLIQKPT